MNKYDVYQLGERWAVRGDNPSGFGDTLHATYDEAVKEAEFQKKKDQEYRARIERIEKEEAEREQTERDMIASYQGFLDGPAMQNGKKRKTLERKIRHNGKVTTRKEVIESKIDSGWWIEGNRLTDGELIYEPATKTELDYAQHLENS